MEPQQYRILSRGEIIQEGDDQTRHYPWKRVNASDSFVGATPDDVGENFIFRRPIPAKSATVEIDENGEPVCQECGQSYTVKYGCEPAEYCFDCVYDVLERLKLKLEKTEAELNENGKILEHLQTQRDTAYNARDGIAELYTKECELRRTAERERDEAKAKLKDLADFTAELGKESETLKLDKQIAESAANIAKKERDEAREYNKIAEANAAHADARIEALQKERDALRAEVGKITVERDSARDLLKDALATMTRLREALEKIANGNLTGTYAAQIAQAALAGKGAQS